MGSSALLVEQAAQGTASRYLQRSRRDRGDKTLLPRAIQEEALSHARVGLLRVAGYAGRQAALVFLRPRWIAGAHNRGPMGRMEEPRDRRTTEVMRDDNH